MATTTDALTDRISLLTDAQLLDTLREADKVCDYDPGEVGQLRRLVRARLIVEVETRWPAADAAVDAAFAAWDAATERGEEPAEVDYVAVLLAAVTTEGTPR